MVTALTTPGTNADIAIELLAQTARAANGAVLAGKVLGLEILRSDRAEGV